jgi:Na+-translocating ferredoxin:NAD+ oxidoreductase RNF subunit RnfB
MTLIYDRLIAGEGEPGDIELIERLAAGMRLGSLCELGRSAPNPVLSTLRYFRSEYEAHIRDKACPAGVCRALTAFEIFADLCDGCHLCAKACPVDAIDGVIKELHVINHETCISCGACLDVCPTDAVRTFPKVKLMKPEVV